MSWVWEFISRSCNISNITACNDLSNVPDPVDCLNHIVWELHMWHVLYGLLASSSLRLHCFPIFLTLSLCTRGLASTSLTSILFLCFQSLCGVSQSVQVNKYLRLSWVMLGVAVLDQGSSKSESQSEGVSDSLEFDGEFDTLERRVHKRAAPPVLSAWIFFELMKPHEVIGSQHTATFPKRYCAEIGQERIPVMKWAQGMGCCVFSSQQNAR